MTLALLAAAGLVGVLATTARMGWGSRPAYVALVLLALLSGSSCVGMTPSHAAYMESLNSGDRARRRADEWFFAHGFPVAAVWFGAALGGVFAVILYRRPAAAFKHCPYCAEPILVAATVCKHCRRDLPGAA